MPTANNLSDVIRKQLFRELFSTLDRDQSGSLDLLEVENLGRVLMGGRWKRGSTRRFMDDYDTNLNATISITEFMAFCDHNLFYPDAQMRDFSKAVKGFIRLVDRQDNNIATRWKARSITLDYFARLLFTTGYLLSLGKILSLDEADLNKIMMPEHMSEQFMLVATGFWPSVIAFPLFMTYCAYVQYKRLEAVKWIKSHQDEFDRATQAAANNMPRASNTGAGVSDFNPKTASGQDYPGQKMSYYNSSFANSMGESDSGKHVQRQSLENVRRSLGGFAPSCPTPRAAAAFEEYLPTIDEGAPGKLYTAAV